MIEHVDLAPGATTCRLINGGWQLSAGHDLRGGIDRRALLGDLCRLVDAGLRTFDCADIYTGVEELLGELARLRPGIRVHTKFVPDRDALATLDAAYVEAVIDRSLQRLGVEVIDLVQFHWWDYDVPGMVDAAGWLDGLREAGKIRHLGVTNMDRPHVSGLVEAGIPLVAHQCQVSLLDRRALGGPDPSRGEPSLQQICRDHDIHLLVYGTLAGGFLTDRWLGDDPPEDPANRSQVKYSLIIEEFGGWGLFQDLLAALAEVAARHAVSVAAVAIRWVLDQQQVAAAIVGARSSAYLASNLSAFDLCLDADDLGLIDAVLDRAAGPVGPVFGLEREPGGRHQRIMKTDLNRLD